MKTQKLKLSEKLTFGLGDFGANYSWTFIASFITIYLTDTVGMSAAIIGTILLLARVADGFTDLFMGTVIDNTNTKMGKAKPWIFWTAPILGILTFMLFNVPGFFSETGQVAYVFIVYLLLSAVFYTANNIAYSSLTSFVTNDEEDRVALGSIRFIFANAAVLSITTFTTYLVGMFGGGQQGWTWTSLLYALLCAVVLVLTGVLAKEGKVSNARLAEQKVSFIAVFKALFTNRYFILALILYLLWYLRQTENGIRVYYATYIFDDANVMAPMSLAALVPMILGLLIAPKLAGKLEVRRC